MAILKTNKEGTQKFRKLLQNPISKTIAVYI